MKKHNLKQKENGIQAEYDFRGGVRGKYASRYAQGTNLVLLSPDVASFFPDSLSVNRALKSLIKLDRTKKARRGRALGNKSVPAGSARPRRQNPRKISK